MPKNSTLQGNSIWIQEVFRIFSIAMGLLVLQFVLNTIGYGGITVAVATYVLAIATANMFTIDGNGIRASNDSNMTSQGYLTRAGVDFILFLLGLLMWFIVGIWQGLDKTINSFQKPEDAFNDLSGTNLLTRFLYAEISHLTVFAFFEIWVNLINAISALMSTK